MNSSPATVHTKFTENFNSAATAELAEQVRAGVPVTESVTLDTLGANARTKSFFEGVIAAAWQKSTQGIFDTGRWLLAAREELDPDVFKALRLPFSVRTRDRLIKIATHPILKTHVSRVPPHWGTLYALTQVPDEVLVAKFRDNTITPNLERRDVRLQVLGLSPKPKKPEAAPDLAAILSAATDNEVKAAFERVKDVTWLLRVLPKDWRGELEARVTSLRTRQNNGAHAEPHLKASEMVRRALSLVKIAGTAPITPAVAASNEREALAALRQLNVVLANFEIDEITIVRQHAKEKRCAKSRSRRRAA